MRAEADRSLGENGRYRSVAGSGEAMTLANATADLITVAQAFHWFDAIRARTEFLRVLKPQGLAALVWNDRVEDDPLQAALTGIFREFGGAKHEALVAHEEHSDMRTFFGATRPWHEAWPHAQRLGEDGLQSLAFSRSYMPDRSTHAGRGAGERVRDVFKSFSRDGAVELRYRTELFLGRPG
jgi:SAM-dependent methyltransferase